jgi:hypothetical protein
LAAWQEYGLATFLMGTQGRSAYFFSPSKTTNRNSWYPLYNLILGNPTGTMTHLTGNTGPVYERTFQFGVSLVNNTSTPSVVNLSGGPYYDINGKQMGGSSISVGANTGIILRTRVTPIVIIMSGPSSPNTSTSGTVTFASDTPGSTFTCSLDGAAAQPCTSPVSYSSLALGPHLVSVQPTGPTGIVGTAIPYVWDITDGRAPVASFETTPANGSGASATFTFSSTEPASSFTCSLNGAPPVLCNSPYTVTGLTSGVAQSMTIDVTDPFGTPGTPATYSWTP